MRHLHLPPWGRQMDAHVIVYPEGGAGDCIQGFAGALKLAQRVARVTVEAPTDMLDLLRASMPPSIPVVHRSDGGATHRLSVRDLHCYRGHAPFLKPGGRTYCETRPTILLHWAGGALTPHNAQRSFTPTQFQPLFDVIPNATAWTRCADMSSWSETARNISGVRAVIGCDSGPVHIAAALGIPTIVVTRPECPDRRWDGARPLYTAAVTVASVEEALVAYRRMFPVEEAAPC